MKIIYTWHARDRMEERGVTEFDLRYALNSYNITISRGDKSTKLIATLPTGRTLKVWVHGGLPIKDPVIIITVAWEE